MRPKLIVLPAFLMCLACSFATNISLMEYFIDGNDLQSSSLPFTGDSLVVGEGLIDLSGLSPGPHTLSFRVKDQQNLWSHHAHRLVFHTATDAPELCSYHYRLDSGPVQSAALLPWGENTWMLDTEITFAEDTSPGLHCLRSWVVDSEGRSSLHAHRLIYHLSDGQSSNITQFAWFFSGNEADPLQIYYHNLDSAMPDITQDLLIALPTLSPGLTYTLNLMAIQADGTPSLRSSYSFIYDLTVDNLVITLDSNQILLSWDEVPDALHYLVEIKADPDAEGEWQQVPDNSFSTPADSQREFYRVKVVK